MLGIGTVRKILIVEDDETSAWLLESFLRSEGYEVILARDGFAAVERYQSADPDLIIMDILLPGQDGYAATEQIRAITRNEDSPPPIIFLTAIESDAELARCLDCGGDDFVVKPFNPIILKARIHSLLERLALAEEKQLALFQIASVLDKLRQSSHFQTSDLVFLERPLGRISGDVVLSTSKANGNRLVVIGDFTGHGLPAAICGSLVIPLFYEMAAADADTESIIGSINTTLYEKLPSGFFMAASVIEFNPHAKQVTFWNFAAPGCFIRRGEAWQAYPLYQLPLGAVEQLPKPLESATLAVQSNDRVYAYSDGLCDTLGVMLEKDDPTPLIQFLDQLFCCEATEGAITALPQPLLDQLTGAYDDITAVVLTIP
ncbi:response regulator receiver protein [Magnetococcus marinus MC-1]|uniref:Response regulator receiver protein n=1 Tax=Magnetococcus marinus (strain ATCC BAA-1437 / JCM 17883 / MC-1) TaxID=156889 RepID=A0L4R7_MAGMM|nr:response regulator receiver protein [Magnetococcus marinus MC-1]